MKAPNPVYFIVVLAILDSLLLMNGCATNPSKAHDYCNDDKLIKFKSAADVAALPDYLAKEIDAHNVAHRKACVD